MKFAMNGALTVGTLDGANVEIREEVGAENFFLFGMQAPEVKILRDSGYRPRDFIAKSPRLREIVDMIASGFFSPDEPDRFLSVADDLQNRDQFMVCADFEAYVEAEALAAKAFLDKKAWSKAALFNIAGSARFSSDETIKQYAKEIWKIRPLPVDMGLLSEH
jgi:glycogen phosphorylase